MSLEVEPRGLHTGAPKDVGGLGHDFLLDDVDRVDLRSHAYLEPLANELGLFLGRGVTQISVLSAFCAYKITAVRRTAVVPFAAALTRNSANNIVTVALRLRYNIALTTASDMVSKPIRVISPVQRQVPRGILSTTQTGTISEYFTFPANHVSSKSRFRQIRGSW